MRRPAILLLAAATAAACDSLPPTVVTPPAVPAHDFLNGPAEPGEFVLRVLENEFFVLINSDRASGLISVLRVPASGEVLQGCGGAGELDPAALQLVFHRSGAVNMLLLSRGVNGAVYERRAFNAALRAGGLCEALATQVPLASGPVDATSYDNEAFFSGAHPDAFGWSARGTLLSAADGAPLAYRSEYHGVLAVSGDLLHLVSTVRVSPAPH
jgi:hypothetical protein